MKASQIIHRLRNIRIETHNVREAVLSTLGTALAISLLMAFSHWHNPETIPWFLIASLAASTLIVFATPHAPMAQPWSLIMGQILSGLAGLLAWQWVASPWLAATVAVSGSTLLMLILRCRHAPGAATALFIALGGPVVDQLGWQLLWSHLLPSLILLTLVAFVFNFPFSWRRYPINFLSTSPVEQKSNTHQIDTSMEALDHSDLVYASEHLKGYFELSEEEFMELYRSAKEHHLSNVQLNH